MSILDYIRDRKAKKEQEQWELAEEKRLAELKAEMEAEREENLKKVRGRYYKKSDLRFFAQSHSTLSEENRYFICGYFNVDGTRFRDISTGNVYNVYHESYGSTFTQTDENIDIPTMIVGGDTFVEIRSNVVSEGLAARSINVFPMNTSLSKGKSAFYDVKSSGDFHKALHVYDLFDTNSNDGVISGEDLLSAISEANAEAESVVKRKIEAEKEEEAIRQFERKRNQEEEARKRRELEEERKRQELTASAGLTVEERDF